MRIGVRGPRWGARMRMGVGMRSFHRRVSRRIITHSLISRQGRGEGMVGRGRGRGFGRRRRAALSCTEKIMEDGKALKEVLSGRRSSGGRSRR